MAYARFGGDSDVYVYQSDTWECSGCRINHEETQVFTTLKDLLEHLKDHEKAGHKVPEDCFARIDHERQTGVGLLSDEPVPWDDSDRAFFYKRERP